MKQILYVLILGAWHAAAHADFITVGPNAAACDEPDMDAALSRGVDEIRFVNQGMYTINQTVSSSVWIEGGYASCEDASLGIHDYEESEVIKSRLGKNNSLNVLSIDGGQASVEVVLVNMIFADGDNINGTDGVGGIHIRGENTQVRMFGSAVVNNAGDTGGGIMIEAGASLRLARTNVSSNTASLLGGGIYCQAGASVTIGSAAAVSHNSSLNGGGLYITDNCRLWNHGSIRQQPVAVEGGIFSNFATQRGGGVLVDNGSLFVVDYSFEGLSLHDNRAEYCGGIVIRRMAQVFLKEAIIDGNVANVAGGGVCIQSGGSLSNLNKGTAIIQNNLAAFSAAMSVTGEDSRAELVNARITNNTASQGTALTVSSGAAMTMDSEGCGISGSCMLVDGNLTHVGGMMLVRDASLQINNSKISNNTNKGGAGLQGMFEFNSSDVKIANSLIVDNDLRGNLFVVKDDVGINPSVLQITHSTVVNNSGSSVIHNDAVQFDSATNVVNSIIMGSGGLLSSSDDDGFTTFLCNLTDNHVELIADENAHFLHHLQSQANEVIGGDNYRLREDSWAIDMCEGVADFTFDIEGKLRGDDYPPVVNFQGSFDAGAYEFDPNDQSDIIFKDGYE